MANVSMYQTSGGFESGLRSGQMLGQALRQTQSRNALQDAAELIQQGQDPNAVIQQLMATDPAAAQQLLNMQTQQQQQSIQKQEMDMLQQKYGMQKLQMAGLPLFGAIMQDDPKVQDKLIDEASSVFKGQSDGIYDALQGIKQLPLDGRVNALGGIVKSLRQAGVFPDDPSQMMQGQSADIAKFEYWKQLNPNATEQQKQEMYSKIIDPYSRAYATGLAKIETEQGLNPVLAAREAGKTEAVEGTATGQARLQQEKQAVAKGEREVSESARNKENAVASINQQLQQLQRLESHPGFGSAVGLSSVIPSVPGSKAYGFEKQLEKLDAQSFMAMIPNLAGMGALSNAEGQKVSAALSALSTGLGEEEFKSEMNAIRETLMQARDRIKTGNLIKPEQQAQQQASSIGRFKVEVE